MIKARRGLLLAAPHSGSGKTLVSLALLAAAREAGLPVGSAKSGPDYIDPRFHEAASGVPCVNLDAFAMGVERLRFLAQGAGTLLIEGAMGLFDGAPPDSRGSSADLAKALGAPVVLLVDAGRMAGSVAALVSGFMHHDSELSFAGVILNRVASTSHEAQLRAALAPIGLPVLGVLPRSDRLNLPSRHLGLVQAAEAENLGGFLSEAARWVGEAMDIRGLFDCAAPLIAPKLTGRFGMPPPGQRIAVAKDLAFSFTYPHLIDDWRDKGAEILPFSPLADEAVPDADFIYLPGGYPELHLAELAGASRFKDSLSTAALTTPVFGECGGYMTLGQSIIDGEGKSWPMAGLLDLVTSFQGARLHLGYRHLQAARGPLAGAYVGHEFHYARTISAEGEALFATSDATGTPLPPMGLIAGNVGGSFAHLIEPLPPADKFG